MDNIRFIDGDSHVLEPEKIWTDYLEKKYQPLVKGHVRWVRGSSNGDTKAIPLESGKENPMSFELEIEVMGRRPLGDRDPNSATRGFEGRDLDELERAYGKWADQDFPASAYREVMDTYGVDHMIL